MRSFRPHEVQPAEPDDCCPGRAACVGCGISRICYRSRLFRRFASLSFCAAPPSLAAHLPKCPLKFSIRDLLFVTVIVALVVGWWVDRNRLAKEIEELENFEVDMVVPGMPGVSMSVKELKQRSKDFEDLWNKKTDAERAQEAKEQYEWEHRWENKFSRCPILQHPPQIRRRSSHCGQFVPLPEPLPT